MITTQESAIRIIDKTGPLHNPADRDHCIQYMVAVGLIFGELTADHYEDDVARDPRIDALARQDDLRRRPAVIRKIISTRTSARSPTPCRFFSRTGRARTKVAVEYPIGHRRRRAEGMPLLVKKFAANLASRFAPSNAKNSARCAGCAKLDATPVDRVYGHVRESCLASNVASISRTANEILDRSDSKQL